MVRDHVFVVGNRRRWRIAAAVTALLLLAGVLGVVATALNPAEGINVADLAAVILAAATVAIPVILWAAKRSSGLLDDSFEPPAALPNVRQERVSQPVPAAIDVAPSRLPAAILGFAGRVSELEMLTNMLEEAQRSGVLPILTIDGTAGVGKTTLAVYWAHQISDRFPNGQFYVNLRGFDPAGSPMAPVEALRFFFDALEVPPERIPLSLDAQESLYRGLLAERRILLVLDNARDTTQIRSLLPGSAGCAVIVTSRNRLTNLIATQGALSVTLGLLASDEAREVLVRRIGRARIEAENEVASEIVNLCARLPLALSIVAARAVIHPEFPLVELLRELRSSAGRLEALDAGEVTSNVRAVFSWSYEHLSKQAARLFRYFGIHPGPDITAPAAASLMGVTATHVRPILVELARSHLISERSPGRFEFHDLLRAYASEQENFRDSDYQQKVVKRRLLEHYLHTAYAGALLLHQRQEPIALTQASPGVTPETLNGHSDALNWFEVEYRVLLACIPLAANSGYPALAWQLPWTMVEYFRRRGHWHDWAATEEIALAATRGARDRNGEANALAGIGRACPWIGRERDAHIHLQEAMRLFEDLGDVAGLAHTHNSLGGVLEQVGRPTQALYHAQLALAISQNAGYQITKATALNDLGWYYLLLDDPQQGLTHCQEALTSYENLGDLMGKSSVLDSIGFAYYKLGDFEQAISYYSQSILLHREVGDRHGETVCLDHIGDAYEKIGDLKAAIASWQASLDILDHLGLIYSSSLERVLPGYPHVAQIRNKLSKYRESC